MLLAVSERRFHSCRDSRIVNAFYFVLVVLIVMALARTVRATIVGNGNRRRLGLGFTASAFLVVGFGIFLGSVMSAYGGLNWLPKTFEWPISGSTRALVLAGGERVVPHEPTSRIQIYGADHSFMRGWAIDAEGGMFVLAPSDDSSFYVYTARGKMKYKYDVLGNQLLAERYTTPYPYSNNAHRSVELQPRLFLWPFTHPFFGIVIGFIGMFLALFVRHRH